MTAVTTASERSEAQRLSRDPAAARAVCRHPCGRHDPAVRQQRLLGADRHAGGDLLGAGLRPQPGRRLRRSSGHRLCRAADARRLYHKRAGCRQCHAAGAGFRRIADRGLRRRRVRRHRRLAGLAVAHVLFRDVDAWLRHHRHADCTGLAERHRRRHRHCRSGISGALQYRLGLLLSLRGVRGFLRPG